jgi:anti-sigma regulatory factor (Ser/Thr protein kinase)
VSGDSISAIPAADLSVRLPHDLTAPRLARQLVGDLAHDRGSGSEAVFNARLAVSELVSNAVLHGAEPMSLDLWLRPERLRVEVTDAASTAEAFFRPSGCRGGFGLGIVAGVADAWGVDFRPAGQTTTVWFEMRL